MALMRLILVHLEHLWVCHLAHYQVYWMESYCPVDLQLLEDPHQEAHWVLQGPC